jgi:hypothetical protein
MKHLPTALVVLLLAALGNAAFAQAPLRWKLEPGQSLIVEVKQQTTSVVAFSGKTAETKIDQSVELRWTVGKAEEKGITVTQKVERIVFQLDSAKAGAIAYDSADPKRPTGQAGELAEAVKPLMGAEVTLVMTDRGEITSARPANGAAEKLFGLAAAAEQPGVFSKQAIETLLRQPLAELPENAVAEGETWTRKSDLDAALGKFKQTTTHRLAGTQEQEGQHLVKIEHSAKIEPAAGAAPPAGKPLVTLKAHEQSGHYLFSPELGRVVSATQKQKLTTERPYRETTIVVTLDSTQTTTIKPAE